MPSFIIHSIAGVKLQEKLKLTEEDKKRFFIGNLMPDSKKIKIKKEWNEVERRQNIQLEKKSTHFRENIDEVLEYPSMKLFLDKYEKEVSSNIVSFAYMFHLYTDYYYFKYFLPSVVIFLDKDMNKTIIKKDAIYTKINNTGTIMKKVDFFGKKEVEGIYQEYTRLNKYLMNKYNFICSCSELNNFLDNNNFITNIEEVDSANGYQVIEKLSLLLKETEECVDFRLRIFKEEDVCMFIDNVVDTFMSNYINIIDYFR